MSLGDIKRAGARVAGYVAILTASACLSETPSEGEPTRDAGVASAHDASAPDTGGEDAPSTQPHDAASGAEDAEPEPASPTTPDFLEQLADPLGPALGQPGQAYLRSSRQPEDPLGMRNLDFSNFLRREEGVAILADEEGAGVITRMWFTVGPPGFFSGDDVRLRFWIDGEVLPLTDHPDGVTLTELTSGELSGLPRPWVLAPGDASGGYIVNVPIHYSNGLRIELVNPRFNGPAFYYQIEGRALPSPPTHSFSIPPAPEHDERLTQALTYWREHAHPGVLETTGHPTLLPEQTLSLRATGEGAITELAFGVARTLRELVEVEVEVDGELAVSTSLAWLTGSGYPAGTYVASLNAANDEVTSLYYPIPFFREAEVRVRHHDLEAHPVSLGMRVDKRKLPPNAGYFRTTCGSSRVDLPMLILDDWNSPLEFPNVVVGGPLKGPGWYSGQSIYLHSPIAWGWVLEPDHEIFVDGSYPILGTGSEDYFGGAFYFMHGPFASLLSGATGWLREGDESERLPSHTHVYRHHLIGSIPFEQELRFEYESYVHDARYDGCLFWYAAR